MKYILKSIAICLFVLTPLVAYAQENIITAEVLKADSNLVNSIKTITLCDGSTYYHQRHNNININTVSVIGIHQEGVNATIYCSFIGNGKQRIAPVPLILRFNSGKWYIPGAEKFLGQ